MKMSILDSIPSLLTEFQEYPAKKYIAVSLQMIKTK